MEDDGMASLEGNGTMVSLQDAKPGCYESLCQCFEGIVDGTGEQIETLIDARDEFAEGGERDGADADPSSRRIDFEAKHALARDALLERRYEEFVEVLRDFPELLGYKPDGDLEQQTIGHLLAARPDPPPEGIILQAISQDPTAAAVTDFLGNTPLHRAAMVLNQSNLYAFEIYLKFHRASAAVRNGAGDLPLHIVASTGAEGSDEAARDLLDVYGKGLTVRNGAGRTPLHVSCSQGFDSIDCLKELLAFHAAKGISVSDLDGEGNSALHSAIKSSASIDAILAFGDELDTSFLGIYLTQDHLGDLPLHSALKYEGVDERIISFLIGTSPFTGASSDGQGKMPVELACQAGISDDLVLELLRTDMPIELGQKRGIIIDREHGYSWWHVVVAMQDRYRKIVDDLLHEGSLVEVVALANSAGPLGYTTMSSLSEEMRKVFRRHLNFLKRYDVCTEPSPFTVNDVQIFSAVDLTNPRSEDKRLVTVRCYGEEVDFEDEIEVRENNDLSSAYVEGIRASYKANKDIIPGYSRCIAFTRPGFTVDELLGTRHAVDLEWLITCRALLLQTAEALDHLHGAGLAHGYLDPSKVGNIRGTWKLLEIGRSTPMGSAMTGDFRLYSPPEAILNTGSKHLESVKKTLRREAKDLEQNLSLSRSRSMSRSRSTSRAIGGFNDSDAKSASSSNTAKSRKLFSRIRSSSKGDEASELIISMQELEIQRLKESLAIKDKQMRSKKKKSSAPVDPDSRFAPETCLASPAWDAYSFGEIMARLLLEESILVPAFDATDEGALQRLTYFDKQDVATVREDVRQVAGDLAADLVSRLLDPSPETRLSTMRKILTHRYFHDEVQAPKGKGFWKKKKQQSSGSPMNMMAKTDDQSAVSILASP